MIIQSLLTSSSEQQCSKENINIETSATLVYYEGGLKSSYNDIIPIIDAFFNQWDPNTATQVKEVSGS